MTLGKEHSTEHFSDALGDMKMLFSTRKSHAVT